jgi:hypothetical protein
MLMCSWCRQRYLFHQYWIIFRPESTLLQRLFSHVIGKSLSRKILTSHSWSPKVLNWCVWHYITSYWLRWRDSEHCCGLFGKIYQREKTSQCNACLWF